MPHLPVFLEDSDPMHAAQQPLHSSEGMPMCAVRKHSLEQELHSRKPYFCWSSALLNHCLKEADEEALTDIHREITKNRGDGRQERTSTLEP